MHFSVVTDYRMGPSAETVLLLALTAAAETGAAGAGALFPPVYPSSSAFVSDGFS